MKMDIEIGLEHGLNMKNSALNLFNNSLERYAVFSRQKMRF